MTLIASLATGCLLPPVVLTRVEDLEWKRYEVSPQPGITFVVELPAEPEPGREDPPIGCDGTPYRDLSYKLCNAPLAYYPRRYGWVANYGIFVGGEPHDLSLYGAPEVSPTGVAWRYYSWSRGERGDVAQAVTTLPSGEQVLAQAHSTTPLKEGYVDAILREGTRRFEIRQ